MNKGFKQKLKFIVPLLILVLGVSFIFVFEFYIKDKVNTEPVIVASRDIPFKKQITEDDLTVKHIHKDYLISETFRPDEMEYLIGTYASIGIKAGTQMYPELVDEYDLVPDESKGEFIAPLPTQWLFAVPGTLKRSYVADIYVVGSSDQLLLEQLINDSYEYEGNETVKNESEQESVEDTKTINEQSQQEISSFLKQNYDPILKDVRIAHVRDGANQEITKNPESSDPNSATANISSLEIIATNETLATIRQYVDQGYKLYITYDYERGNDNGMDNGKGVEEHEINTDSQQWGLT